MKRTKGDLLKLVFLLFFSELSNNFLIKINEKRKLADLIGAPGVTRTRGTRIRNPLLYPPELQGQWIKYRIYESFRQDEFQTLKSFVHRAPYFLTKVKKKGYLKRNGSNKRRNDFRLNWLSSVY